MADKPAASQHRNSKVGEVISHSGNKTIVVEVTRRIQEPLYKRFIHRRKRFYAHDEQNQCQPGDRVRIVETRPLSRLKRWRLEQILHRGSVITAGAAPPAPSAAAPEAGEKAS